MSTWILVFFMAGYQKGGPAVIDNIESLAECQRIQQNVEQIQKSNYEYIKSRCIEVRRSKK